MKKYKVRGVGTEFLQEVEIEAKSEELAKEEFRDMWENGELHAMDYELDIKIEEESNG
jgi:hypothetical protein